MGNPRDGAVYLMQLGADMCDQGLWDLREMGRRTEMMREYNTCREEKDGDGSLRGSTSPRKSHMIGGCTESRPEWDIDTIGEQCMEILSHSAWQ